MIWDHEAAGSSPVIRTIAAQTLEQEVSRTCARTGPVLDLLIFYMGSSSRGRISNIVSYESKNGMHEPV